MRDRPKGMGSTLAEHATGEQVGQVAVDEAKVEKTEEYRVRLRVVT